MNKCAVIVTYNRYELLKVNLNEISKQIKYNDIDIIIVDNHSNENHCDDILKEFSNLHINYFYLDENLGGAGGFNFGLSKSYELGYEWTLLLDDDGHPFDECCFKCLFDYVEKNDITATDKVLINSLVMLDSEHLTFGLIRDQYHLISNIEKAGIINEKGFINDLVNPFNGTLVSRGLVSAIGFPNKNFFICNDEFDYVERARNSGALIGTVFNAHYYHPQNHKFKYKKLPGGRYFDVNVSSTFSNYYAFRNRTYSILHNYDKKTAKKLIRKMTIIHLLAITFGKCNKIKEIKTFKKAYKDGKNGKLGKLI